MSRVSVRMPESLHRQLSRQADQEGVSLNQYLVYLLAQRSAPEYSVHPVASEEVEEQRAAYASLLDRLGSASHREIGAALAGRAPVEAEPGLTPEVVERLRERIGTRAAPRRRQPA